VGDPPIEMPVEWDKYVDEPLTEKELERLWQSVNRQSPFGDIIWQQKVCKALWIRIDHKTCGKAKEK
jgi:putative transposase